MHAVGSEHLLSMKNLGPIIKLECFSCAIMCACCLCLCDDEAYLHSSLQVCFSGIIVSCL